MAIKRRDCLVFSGILLLVVSAIYIVWQFNIYLFSCRYGQYLPLGVYSYTEVRGVSRSPPPGVPKTLSRVVRETFGCYGPPPGDPIRNRENSMMLVDRLTEFGVEIRDGKLFDAAGREIRILRWSRDWEEQYRNLHAQGYVVFIVAAEDE